MEFVITTPEDTILQILLKRRATLLVDTRTEITFSKERKGVNTFQELNYTVEGDENPGVTLLAERILRAHNKVVVTLADKELTFGKCCGAIKAHYMLSEFE